MKSNRDIYRAASILVEGYGRELAPGMALRHSDALSSGGDVRGSLVWMKLRNGEVTRYSRSVALTAARKAAQAGIAL